MYSSLQCAKCRCTTQLQIFCNKPDPYQHPNPVSPISKKKCSARGGASCSTRLIELPDNSLGIIKKCSTSKKLKPMMP
jgi:hypothetical protein